MDHPGESEQGPRSLVKLGDFHTLNPSGVALAGLLPVVCKIVMGVGLAYCCYRVTHHVRHAPRDGGLQRNQILPLSSGQMFQLDVDRMYGTTEIRARLMAASARS